MHCIGKTCGEWMTVMIGRLKSNEEHLMLTDCVHTVDNQSYNEARFNAFTLMASSDTV
jgi:hypothetical protein